ncbi:hypothetical protein GCM10018965_083170 [Nonomuraea roseola]
MDRWLIVGLGNPGAEYEGNRHNAGFMVLDELAARAGGRFKAHKSRAHVLETRGAVLAKPQTYMNLSGGPTKLLADFYKIGPERLIVIHDELDIPYGALRAKLGGGDNGHNGLKSITKSLATRDYLRVRFGIGRPPRPHGRRGLRAEGLRHRRAQGSGVPGRQGGRCGRVARREGSGGDAERLPQPRSEHLGSSSLNRRHARLPTATIP